MRGRPTIGMCCYVLAGLPADQCLPQLRPRSVSAKVAPAGVQLCVKSAHALAQKRSKSRSAGWKSVCCRW